MTAHYHHYDYIIILTILFHNQNFIQNLVTIIIRIIIIVIEIIIIIISSTISFIKRTIGPSSGCVEPCQPFSSDESWAPYKVTWSTPAGPPPPLPPLPSPPSSTLTFISYMCRSTVKFCPHSNHQPGAKCNMTPEAWQWQRLFTKSAKRMLRKQLLLFSKQRCHRRHTGTHLSINAAYRARQFYVGNWYVHTEVYQNHTTLENKLC
jgi:hypothetical protein